MMQTITWFDGESMVWQIIDSMLLGLLIALTLLLLSWFVQGSNNKGG